MCLAQLDSLLDSSLLYLAQLESLLIARSGENLLTAAAWQVIPFDVRPIHFDIGFPSLRYLGAKSAER